MQDQLQEPSVEQALDIYDSVPTLSVVEKVLIAVGDQQRIIDDQHISMNRLTDTAAQAIGEFDLCLKKMGTMIASSDKVVANAALVEKSIKEAASNVGSNLQRSIDTAVAAAIARVAAESIREAAGSVLQPMGGSISAAGSALVASASNATFGVVRKTAWLMAAACVLGVVAWGVPTYIAKQDATIAKQDAAEAQKKFFTAVDTFPCGKGVCARTEGKTIQTGSGGINFIELKRLN